MYLNSFVYSKFIEILSKLTIRILKDYLFIFRILIFCLPCSRAAIDYFFDYIGNAVIAGILSHAHKGQR